MNNANNNSEASLAPQTLSSLLLQTTPVPPPLPIIPPPKKPSSSSTSTTTFGRVPSSVAPGQTPPPLTGTCDACGKVATQQHLNYGANTCLGCRAFFRRIVQRQCKDKLRCKGGNARGEGPCKVSGTKGRCQRCRFERCLAAGMREECVMTRLDPAQFAKKQQQQEQQQPKPERKRPREEDTKVELTDTMKAMPAFSLPRTLLAKHLKEKAARKTDLGLIIMRELKRRSEERAALKRVIVQKLAMRRAEESMEDSGAKQEEEEMELEERSTENNAEEEEETSSAKPVFPPLVYPILLDLAARRMREKLQNNEDSDEEGEEKGDAPLDLSMKSEKGSDFSIDRLVQK